MDPWRQMSSCGCRHSKPSSPTKQQQGVNGPQSRTPVPPAPICIPGTTFNRSCFSTTPSSSPTPAPGSARSRSELSQQDEENSPRDLDHWGPLVPEPWDRSAKNSARTPRGFGGGRSVPLVPRNVLNGQLRRACWTRDGKTISWRDGALTQPDPGRASDILQCLNVWPAVHIQLPAAPLPRDHEINGTPLHHKLLTHNALITNQRPGLGGRSRTDLGPSLAKGAPHRPALDRKWGTSDALLGVTGEAGRLTRADRGWGSESQYLGRPCDACSHRQCELYEEETDVKNYKRARKQQKVAMFVVDKNKWKKMAEERTRAVLQKISGPGKALPRLAAMQQMLVDPEYLQQTQEAEIAAWERLHLKKAGYDVAGGGREGAGTAGPGRTRGREAPALASPRTASVVVRRPDMQKHVREGRQLLRRREQQESVLQDSPHLLVDILDYQVPGVKCAQNYAGLLESGSSSQWTTFTETGSSLEYSSLLTTGSSGQTWSMNETGSSGQTWSMNETGSTLESSQ